MDANLETYRAATSYFWRFIIECRMYGLTLDRATNNSLLPFRGDEIDLARGGGSSKREFPHSENKTYFTETITFRKKETILSASVLHQVNEPALIIEHTRTIGMDAERCAPLVLGFSGSWTAQSIFQKNDDPTYHEETLRLARALKHFEIHPTEENEGLLEITEPQALTVSRSFMESFKSAR